MKRVMVPILACVCLFAEAAPSAKKLAKSGRRPAPAAQSKRRIAEIAGWLPEKPAAPGALISDRQAWEKLSGLETAGRIIRKAEQILKLPVPDCPDDLYLEYSRTGFRTDYEIPYNARISNAQTLAAAECLENKERFLPKLTEYLEAICAERSWVYPAHDRGLRTFEGKEFNVDLGASARAWGCAWIVSVLKGSMSELLARKVKGELERRVFTTYRSCASRTSNFSPLGWFNGPANWTAVCHSGVVRAALAVVEDRNDRAMFVETAERMLPFYIAGFPDDGYCSEGMGYWNYGWGHYLTLALAIKDATGGRVDLFRDPKTKTIMEFGTGCQMEEGKAPDFADGGGNVSDAVLLLGQRQWPYLTVTTSALSHDLLYGGSSVFSLLAFGQLDGIPQRRVNPLPIRNAFPYGQVWVFRPDPKSTSTAFSVGVKGGHNAEFHNHNDVGSYSIRFDGVLIAGDPGGTEYTALTFSPKRYTIPIISSYGHPVPVLNGCYQEKGREYSARVLHTSFSNDIDRVVLDIAGAYPKPAKIKNVIRTFEYDRAARAFTVSDLVRFKVKGRVSEPILTFGFVEPGKKEGEYKVRVSENDAVRDCNLSISVKGASWKLSDGKRIDNPHRRAPMRYAILVDGEVAEVEISLRFSADEEILGRAIAAEAPPPDAAESEIAAKEGPLLFDEEGGVKAQIVYSTLEERVLARELQWYLGEMAEETFRLAAKEPAEGPAIIVKVDSGEGRILVKDGRVCICGHGKGISRAATHFLEELGVRYLFPGENGLVVPGKTKIMYPDQEWREPPHVPVAEPPPLDRKQLIQLLKSPTPVRRDFYAWHGVEADAMPAKTADGWNIYRAAKGVDPSDAAASEELLVDFRRAAYGPVARTMREYFAEMEKKSPDRAKLTEILNRAVIDAAHEPAISARIRAISESL